MLLLYVQSKVIVRILSIFWHEIRTKISFVTSD